MTTVMEKQIKNKNKQKEFRDIMDRKPRKI